MIKDKLLRFLEANFPKEDLLIGTPPDAIVVFSAKHASVGDLGIWDDGDELTVSIGDITHGHFNCYESNLSDEEKEDRIIEDVADFLKELFADRVLLIKGRWGGGWERLRFTDEAPVPRKYAEHYLWSGPIDADALSDLRSIP